MLFCGIITNYLRIWNHLLYSSTSTCCLCVTCQLHRLVSLSPLEERQFLLPQESPEYSQDSRHAGDQPLDCCRRHRMIETRISRQKPLYPTAGNTRTTSKAWLTHSSRTETLMGSATAENLCQAVVLLLTPTFYSHLYFHILVLILLVTFLLLHWLTAFDFVARY